MAHDPEKVADLWAEYEPRIREARKRDNTSRDDVFLAFDEERIGPHSVIHLTPERYLLLERTGSMSWPVSDMALKRFLWIVSRNFTPSKWAGRWFRCRHYFLKANELRPEVEKYMARTFVGMPGQSKDDRSQSHWVSTMIDLLASQYGWKENEVLQCPLTRIFQYVDQIKQRLTGREIPFSSEADSLQMEFMNKANSTD